MYKDKDRQREAVKLATRRYRLKVSQVSQDTHADVIPFSDTQYGLGCDTKEEAIALAETLDAMENEDSPVVVQHHNPMMVGYVPPRTA